MNFVLNRKLVTSRDYTEFILVYSLYSRQVLVLDGVGADIWRAISEHNANDCEAIVAFLSSKYDIPGAEIEDDINSFIASLIQEGALQVHFHDKPQAREKSAISKSWLNGEGRIVAALRQRNQLYTAMFELTYKCNEKCGHCYVDHRHHHESLDEASCKRLIDQLYDMKCLHLLFSGGDPFLFKGFCNVFEYARSKGFICDIFTNAQYLFEHHDMLERIVQHIPRAFFISLYGADAETHDAITQVAGSFDKTIASAKQLIGSNITVVFNVMVMSVNYSQIERIISLVKDIGADYRLGLSYVYTNRGDNYPMKYFVRDKDMLKKVLALSPLHAMSQDGPVEWKEHPSDESLCGAGETAICIDPMGDVYPCVSLKWKFGNVFEQHLEEIWNGNSRKKLLDTLVWKNAKACLDCPVNNSCQHCAAMSINETGDALSCNSSDKLIAQSLWEFQMEASSEAKSIHL